MRSRGGALVASQVVTSLASIAIFAVLARTLGPIPFAGFAVAVFGFTMVSLISDASVQSLLLVNSTNASIGDLALRLTLISCVGGGILVIFVTQVISSVLGQSAHVRLTLTLAFSVALVAQFATQFFRAFLLIEGKYVALASVDVLSVLMAGFGAVSLSMSPNIDGVSLLAGQLSLAACLRCVGHWLVFQSASRRAGPVDHGRQWTLCDGLRFSGRMIPMNVSAYAGRALDSGLLPLFVDARLGATYSRSYQVSAFPLLQVQLSIAPLVLRRVFRAREAGEPDVERRLYWWIVAFSWCAAGGVLLGAPIIHRVLFGEDWVMVVETVSGMSILLPGLAFASLASWFRQFSPSGRRSLLHLFLVLVSPIVVLCAAWLDLEYEVILWLLVIVGGGLQPQALNFLHRDVLPSSFARRGGALVVGWFVLVFCRILLY